METVDEKRDYAHFRKFLMKNGFIQMQKSVYSKLAINKTVSASIKNLVRKNPPKRGVVQLLEITENQFADTEYVVGASKSDILDSDKRLVIYD
jgi:CRISPR-associated protein Cas2